MKAKYKVPKLPMIEWAYRWLDIFTFFDHPDEVRDDAYMILNKHAKFLKIQHPSAIATTALYLSCEKNGAKFSIDRIDRIMKTYLAHRRMRAGARVGWNGTERIMKRVSQWKLHPV